MHKLLLVGLVFWITSNSFGQNDSSEVKNNFRLYVDTY
jgi:hypothetical protein